MQILEIKGKKWMVGLEWEILPGDSTIKQESKEVAEKTNTNFGVVIDYDGMFAIGLAKKVGKEPSAALYLALANQESRENTEALNDYPDWIVVEDIGDDKYWMGVVKSGLPAPQYDAILSVTEVKERITELLVNDTFTMFSSSGEIIAIFDGIKHIENRSLNDLTADVKTKIKFDKLRGIPDIVVYSGIGVIVLGAIAWGVLSLIEGHSIKEKAETLRRQQQQEEMVKQQQYEAAKKQYEIDKVKIENEARNQVLRGLSGKPNSILNAWFSAVGNLPTGTHGWDLKNIECYYNIDNQPSKFACDYLYKRTGLTTNRMLLQDFPTAKISGNEAVVTKDVAIDANDLATPSVEVLNTLKGASNWGNDMISQLQLLKIVDIDHDVKPSAEITYTLPALPVSPQEQAQGKTANAPETKSLGIAKGEIVVKGSHFDLVKELADNVDFFGTGLRKIKFTVKDLGEISWEASFDYFIKTQDGNLKGSTSVGTSSSSVGGASDAPAAQPPVLNGPPPAIPQ